MTSSFGSRFSLGFATKIKEKYVRRLHHGSHKYMLIIRNSIPLVPHCSLIKVQDKRICDIEINIYFLEYSNSFSCICPISIPNHESHRSKWARKSGPLLCITNWQFMQTWRIWSQGLDVSTLIKIHRNLVLIQPKRMRMAGKFMATHAMIAFMQSHSLYERDL